MKHKPIKPGPRSVHIRDPWIIKQLQKRLREEVEGTGRVGSLANLAGRLIVQQIEADKHAPADT